MVSLSFDRSSISLIVPNTSGGIFLLRFTYLSNNSVIDFDSALNFLSVESTFSSIKSIFDSKCVFMSVNMLMDALCIPSTKTFTVPSGNFNSCSTFATVPKSNRSSFLGSSTAALF